MFREALAPGLLLLLCGALTRTRDWQEDCLVETVPAENGTNDILPVSLIRNRATFRPPRERGTSNYEEKL